jgi:hypothetical protein
MVMRTIWGVIAVIVISIGRPAIWIGASCAKADSPPSNAPAPAVAMLWRASLRLDDFVMDREPNAA